jgi:hypothetical protein
MHMGPLVQYLLFLSNFNYDWNGSTLIRKILQCSSFMKIRSEVLELFYAY